VATGREQAILEGHKGGVGAVAVAPDGSWLASGSWDGTVRIWDVATGRERAILEGHTNFVSAVAVAPDGSWLASGSWDNSVRVWETGPARPGALMRLEGSVNACAWLGTNGLVVGGLGGLYTFDFLAYPSPRL
jgi:WD40 repeat protein